jgi:cytosine/adenosine deaminase-related metal-dependent hydrolase
MQLLQNHGRTSLGEAALRHPAIYILQLRHSDRRHSRDVPRPTGRVAGLAGAQVALTATDAVFADVRLDHTRIGAIAPALYSSAREVVDLTGYTLLPGLINSHDHLEFSLFPRLGRGPYRNCLEWYDDIQRNDAATIERHKAIPKSTRIWFGALRNLLCGVTTVCHHNPLTGDALAEDFPVRVVREFGWAHSIALDKTFVERHHRTPSDQPFIIHVAEGVDSDSARDLAELTAAGALDARTVLVHGLACDHEAAKTINRHDAALIWCPSSNLFLFGRTHSPTALESFKNVTIGSDSPLTAVGDLLDELRFAREQVGVSAEQLYRQSTSEAARILRLPNGVGQIRVGALADLIAIRATSSSPSDALSRLSYRDVHLVLRAGRVQLSSQELLHRIPAHLRQGLRPLETDGLIRWVRAPLGRLFASAVDALGCDVFINGRRLRHVATAWL